MPEAESEELLENADANADADADDQSDRLYRFGLPNEAMVRRLVLQSFEEVWSKLNK